MTRRGLKKIVEALCLIVLSISAFYFFINKSDSLLSLALTSSEPKQSSPGAAEQKTVAQNLSDMGAIALPFTRVFASAPVNDLIVDSSGVVWAATENGVVSIKNNEARRYCLNEGSFPYLQAQCLAYDGQTVWAGSLFGLARLNKDGEFVEDNLTQALPSRLVLSLLYDEDGKALWVGTQNGLVLKRKNSKPALIDNKTSHGALKNNRCTYLTISDKMLAVVNGAGISFCASVENCQNPNWWRTLNAQSLNIIRPISAVCFNKTGIYIASAVSLVKLNTTVEKAFALAFTGASSFTALNGLPANRINDLVFNRGVLWAATAKGLARMKKDRIQRVVPTEGAQTYAARCLCTRGDLLWFGTDNGVQYINTAPIN